MAQENRTREQFTEELARREAALAAGKNSLHRSRQSWPRRRRILRRAKRAC